MGALSTAEDSMSPSALGRADDVPHCCLERSLSEILSFVTVADKEENSFF